MPQLNDLSRFVVALEHDATLIAVIEMGQSSWVAIISYNEKPGIQAIATTAPDLPPEQGAHATFAREHE